MAEEAGSKAVRPGVKYDRENTIYTSGVDQPRDAKGKFRVVLARLKADLGVSGLQNAAERAEEIEGIAATGNYAAAARAAEQLKSVLDRLDAGGLNPQSLENVRESARLLGTAIANLPLPFGKNTEKVRFSDLPPVLRDLMEELMDRVAKKIGEDDAKDVNQKLTTFKSGGDYFSQSEVSQEMSTLLRLLT